MAEDLDSEVTYERWYLTSAPVMDSQYLAELLTTSEQVIRAWAREGVIPAHRPAGGRKFTFFRHKIFEWLVRNRYVPDAEDRK